MSNFVDIGEFIFGRLSEISNLTTYPLCAEQGTSFPYAVYWRSGLSYARTKDGVHESAITYNVSIYSHSYSESINILKEAVDKFNVKSRLHGMSISNFEILNSTETFADDVYIQNIKFSYTISYV